MDEIETQNKTKAEKKKTDEIYIKSVITLLFCCAFNLDFLKLIYKASLIFKSNLELALWIILKERDFDES